MQNKDDRHSVKKVTRIVRHSIDIESLNRLQAGRKGFPHAAPSHIILGSPFVRTRIGMLGR